ncbi:MAG TPA: autotransporter-associated beta strand repeat-containing protein [Tepidisphaeraceae bacterium]|jgi:autotransporter-associated beta strand protein
MQRRSRGSILTILAAASFSLLAVNVTRADNIAINAPPEAGNQAFALGLGIDFTVNAPIEITSLGVFDDNANGIAPLGSGGDDTLTAVLYGGVDPSDRTAGTVLATQNFTTSNPGTLASGSSFRFITLTTPITLQPGRYDIAGYGFDANNLEFNTGAGQTTDNGGGAITYDSSYYSLEGPGAPPENFDSTVIKYAAGSFEFVPLQTFTRTWTGSTDSNWSSTGNWVEGALTSNNPLVFSTVASQPMNNDLSGYSASGMTFTAGGFTLNGNDLANTDRIVSQIGTNTINLNLSLTGNGTQIEVDAGSLIINGNVSAPLPVAGYQFLTKTGSGTLVLNGVNDLQSGMIVNAGTVQIQDISDNGATSSLGVPGQDGTNTSGLLAIYNGTVIVTGTGTQTTARNLYTDQSGTTKVLDIQNAGATVISTGEWRSNGTLANALTKTGPGTLSLQGSDPFFAAATGDRAYNFISVQQGIVQLGRSVGSAVDGITDIAPGATVQITGNDGTQVFVDTAGAYTDPGEAATVGGVQMSGGTFDLDGNNSTINRLSSSVAASTVTNSASGTTSILTIGEQNSNAVGTGGTYAGIDATYIGAIQDGAGKVGITKVGPQSTVTLSGNNSYSGPTNATEGTLVFGSSLTHTVSVTVASGATMRLSSGGGKVLATPSLDVQSGGTLDLTDNAAVINYDPGAGDPTAAISTAIASAYDNGAWDKPGITSSVAAAAPGHALGWINNGSLLTPYTGTYLGQSVDATTDIIRYTYYGDANLDGVVDAADITMMQPGASNPTWAMGDFNYDGKVNADDYALLQLGAAEQPPGAQPSVPEPTALLFVLPFALLPMRQRAVRGMVPNRI